MILLKKSSILISNKKVKGVHEGSRPSDLARIAKVFNRKVSNGNVSLTFKSQNSKS